MTPAVSIRTLVDGPPPSPFKSITELAYSEPDVAQIAPHVFEAHEKAKERMGRSTASGEVTVGITFRPDIRAFELAPEDDEAFDLLSTLGPKLKISVHL